MIFSLLKHKLTNLNEKTLCGILPVGRGNIGSWGIGFGGKFYFIPNRMCRIDCYREDYNVWEVSKIRQALRVSVGAITKTGPPIDLYLTFLGGFSGYDNQEDMLNCTWITENNPLIQSLKRLDFFIFRLISTLRHLESIIINRPYLLGSFYLFAYLDRS